MRARALTVLALVAPLVALGADPAAADPAAGSTAAAPPPAVLPAAPPPAPAKDPAHPDAPMWFKAGGCEVTITLPADGKVEAPPPSGTCDWKGKAKATLPKEGDAPAGGCHFYFKSSGGFIMGELASDKACPENYAAAGRAFIRTREWSDGMYHVALAFTPPG